MIRVALKAHRFGAWPEVLSLKDELAWSVPYNQSLKRAKSPFSQLDTNLIANMQLSAVSIDLPPTQNTHELGVIQTKSY